MLAERGNKNRRSMRLRYGIFSPPSFRRASARLLLLSSSSATVRPGCCPLVPSSVAPSPAASTGEGILTRAARGTAGGSDLHLQDLLSVSTIWDFPLGEKRKKKDQLPLAFQKQQLRRNSKCHFGTFGPHLWPDQIYVCLF